MNKLIFLSLLMLLSCVSEQKKSPSSVGGIRRWDPISNMEDNERMKMVCKALANKENLLEVLQSNGNEYTFSYAKKGCAEATLQAPKDIVTKIGQTDSKFVFKPNNNEAFGFNDVETFSSGALAKICNFAGTLESPIQTSSTGGTWWTTFTAAEHCQAGFNTICVHLQRGSLVENEDFKIHTNEWIKFKVLQDKEGFFIERKLISSAGCGNDQTLIMQATLK